MTLANYYVSDYDRMYKLNYLNNPVLTLGKMDCLIPDFNDTYDFFKHYGITDLEQLDIDGGDIEVDLNKSIKLKRQYKTVMNLGTLEHIWDVHTAWSNALTAVKVGGHFISMAPLSGWHNHGIHLTYDKWIKKFITMNGFKILSSWIKHVPLGTGKKRISIICAKKIVCISQYNKPIEIEEHK